MHDASFGAAPSVRARGGRLTIHHPRPGAAERIQQNEGNHCDVIGCGQTRRGFGRGCRKHAKHHETTGHPTAPAVRRGHWRPYVIEAAAFVHQQLRLDHPSVCAGVEWCAGELLSPTPHSRYADRNRPHTGYAVALARMRSRGVEPAELLSRFIAARYAREWEQVGTFKSEDHWRHQTGRLLLLSSPIGASGWTQRQREEQGVTEPPTVGPRVRAFAFERVGAALGVLAVRSADELVRRFNAKTETAPLPSCIAGCSVPFAA